MHMRDAGGHYGIDLLVLRGGGQVGYHVAIAEFGVDDKPVAR